MRKIKPALYRSQLAILAKITAGWAPLALAVFLFRRRKRCCLLFLAVWLTVVLTAAVTNASADKPPCPVSANARPTFTTDAAGRRHYACARVNRPR